MCIRISKKGKGDMSLQLSWIYILLKCNRYLKKLNSTTKCNRKFGKVPSWKESEEHWKREGRIVRNGKYAFYVINMCKVGILMKYWNVDSL